MKVRWSDSAGNDLETILSYLAERNPRAAESVVEAIETTLVRIGAFPRTAQATDEPGVRMATPWEEL